jgi:hypothetical protein
MDCLVQRIWKRRKAENHLTGESITHHDQAHRGKTFSKESVDLQFSICVEIQLDQSNLAALALLESSPF